MMNDKLKVLEMKPKAQHIMIVGMRHVFPLCCKRL